MVTIMKITINVFWTSVAYSRLFQGWTETPSKTDRLPKRTLKKLIKVNTIRAPEKLCIWVCSEVTQILSWPCEQKYI